MIEIDEDDKKIISIIVVMVMLANILADYNPRRYDDAPKCYCSNNLSIIDEQI